MLGEINQLKFHHELLSFQRLHSAQGLHKYKLLEVEELCQSAILS